MVISFRCTGQAGTCGRRQGISEIAFYLFSYWHSPLLLANTLLILNFIISHFHELHCRNLKAGSGSS